MSFISIESNLGELNKAIQDYAILSRKTIEEALKRQAVNLSIKLKKELKAIAPAKGSVRSDVLSVLAGGSWPSGKTGIRVRKRILQKVFQQQGAQSLLGSRQVVNKRGKTTVIRGGKRLNLWALAVKSEIASRESARGFLGASGRYQGLTASVEGEVQAVSRYGPVLSTAGFKVSPGGGSFEFQWGGGSSELSGSAAEGLSKAKGDAAINRALVNTLEDIESHINDKIEKGWSR